MPGTAYTDNLVSRAEAHGTAYQGPATVYMALVTTTPDKTTPGTLATVASVEVALRTTNNASEWTHDGAGSKTNTADMAWPDELTGDMDADVVGIDIYDNAVPASGNRLRFILLPSPKTFLSGQTPKFLAGDLVLSVA